MVTKKITFLFLASLILSNVGCSGSRLRNMVGRSEYSTLEELEAQDADGSQGAQGEALADSASRNRTGSLVSNSRELDSADAQADPDVKQKQRKGFFDFAKVFNRKTDEAEFAPDPFAEAQVSPEAKTAPVKVAAISDAETVKKQVATKADQFSSTISAVEKQSETIFEESLAKSESALFETEPVAEGAVIAKGQATDGQSEQGSFADFVREQADATPVVADVKKEAAKVFHTASAAKTVTNEFDAFLNETAGSFEETVVADAPDAFFPGLSEEFDAAFEQRDEADPAEADFADKVESIPNTDFVETTFSESAKKHGFAEGESKDPWAAFGQGQAAAVTPRPNAKNTEVVKAQNGFVWGRAIETVVADKPAFTLDNPQPQDLNDVPNHGFLQVSSTRPLETRSNVEVSHSMPLMIPDSPSSYQSASVQNDPFASMPSFEETTEGFPAEIEVAAAVPTVATAEGGLSHWSRRTWFLLIGCLIVAMLLFMPDRNNRTNS